MAEYIEREATCGDCIHAKICEHIPTLTGFDRNNIAYCESFRNAADVVEVVRCKDCDKSEPSNVWDDWVFCQANKIHHRDDNFCSYGERRCE